MLDDKDRIFKNLYGLHDWGLEGARRRGAEVYTTTRVTGVSTEHGRVRGVVTDQGEIETDIVVDAGGMYDLGFQGPGALQLGLSAQNLGPGMRYLDQSSPLPLTVAAGLGYRLPARV